MSVVETESGMNVVSLSANLAELDTSCVGLQEKLAL